MEYIFVEQAKASGEPTPELGKIFRLPEDRPHVGDFMRLVNRPNQDFKIVRSIPSDNPNNVTVTYVLEYVSDSELLSPFTKFDQFFLDSQITGADTYFFQKPLKHRY